MRDMKARRIAGLFAALWTQNCPPSRIPQDRQVKGLNAFVVWHPFHFKSDMNSPRLADYFLVFPIMILVSRVPSKADCSTEERKTRRRLPIALF
jgi:hypothetical protein